MRKLLVTGGTVFVSRYVAEYYAKKGDEVYVLNRNHHTQPEGTTLIEADRRDPGDVLKSHDFDAVWISRHIMAQILQDFLADSDILVPIL